MLLKIFNQGVGQSCPAKSQHLLKMVHKNKGFNKQVYKNGLEWKLMRTKTPVAMPFLLYKNISYIYYNSHQDETLGTGILYTFSQKLANTCVS